MKVLLVVPRSNLPMADAEMQDVLRSGLEVTPLFSPVSQISLTREINADTYDGLWLAGHMDSDGNFLLDSGKLLTASSLTSLVRGRFSWVFINTCQSIKAAQLIQNETEAEVVCTIMDVPDTDAYQTGALFAKALARFDDVRQAWHQSKPGGNRIYVHLAGGHFLAAR